MTTSKPSLLPASAAQRIVDAAQRSAISRDDIAESVCNMLPMSIVDAYPVAMCNPSQQHHQQHHLAQPTVDPQRAVALQGLIHEFMTKTGGCRTVRGFCALLERDHPDILEQVCDCLLSKQVVQQVALEAQAMQAEQRLWGRLRQKQRLALSREDEERYHK